MGHSKYAVLYRDQIFYRDVIRIKAYACFSVISVFVPDLRDLCFYDSEQELAVRKYGLVLGYFSFKLSKLGFELFSLQTGECSEAHFHNSIGLDLIEPESLLELFPCLCCRVGSADDPYDLIYVVKRYEQTIYYVRAILRFFQIISGSSGHHLFLMVYIIRKYLLKV